MKIKILNRKCLTKKTSKNKKAIQEQKPTKKRTAPASEATTKQERTLRKCSKRKRGAGEKQKTNETRHERLTLR